MCLCATAMLLYSLFFLEANMTDIADNSDSIYAFVAKLGNSLLLTEQDLRYIDM